MELTNTHLNKFTRTQVTAQIKLFKETKTNAFTAKPQRRTNQTPLRELCRWQPFQLSGSVNGTMLQPNCLSACLHWFCVRTIACLESMEIFPWRIWAAWVPQPECICSSLLRNQRGKFENSTRGAWSGSLVWHLISIISHLPFSKTRIMKREHQCWIIFVQIFMKICWDSSIRRSREVLRKKNVESHWQTPSWILFTIRSANNFSQFGRKNCWIGFGLYLWNVLRNYWWISALFLLCANLCAYFRKDDFSTICQKNTHVQMVGGWPGHFTNTQGHSSTPRKYLYFGPFQVEVFDFPRRLGKFWQNFSRLTFSSHRDSVAAYVRHLVLWFQTPCWRCRVFWARSHSAHSNPVFARRLSCMRLNASEAQSQPRIRDPYW